MSIIDAVKSGKPFRRKGKEHWMLGTGRIFCSNEDILADDYEIKQEPREFCIGLNRNNGRPVSCELIVCGQFCGGGHDVEIVHAREILE